MVAMGTGEAQKKPSPYLTANPLSKLFFTWIGALFSLANKEKKLSPKDLDDVVPSDESCHLGDKLEREWSKELEKVKLGKKASLTAALTRVFGPTYALFGICAFTEEALRIVQPFILGRLIDYFSPTLNVPTWQAYTYAGAITLSSILLAFVHSPYFFQIQCIGMRVRVSLCTLVYHKMLCLDNISMRKSSSGKVNNLMTNDVSRFEQVFIFLHYLWLGPLQASAVFVLLWFEIGWACVPGYIVLFLLMPLQAVLSKLFGSLRRKTASFTDKRVGTMTEIINAIRVIKMYAWEHPFGDVIQKIRKSEVRKIIQASYPLGVNLMLSVYGNRLIDVCMIVTYAFIATEIRVSTIFVVVTYCLTLRSSFMRFFPRGIQLRSECLVSIKRIQEFLLLDEISAPSVQPSDDGLVVNPGIHVKGMSGSWDNNLTNPALTNVTFDVGQDELLAVIGPVGSGKSTLLMALLKELPTISGDININGRISYASQEPWVFSGTIRQNITFGKEFNQRKFDKILNVCSLDKDIKSFSNGDLTIVGERGVTLSGGQKARVNLARSLYDDADIYILDDPLSAVDSEVGRHIFDECIMQYLADKPRILITHQLQFLNTANKILVLKEGNMEAVGPLNELHEKNIDFASLMKVEEEEEDEELEEGAVAEHPGLRKRSSTRKSLKTQRSFIKENKSGPPKAFKDEKSKKGDVSLRVYFKYFKSGANCCLLLLLLLFLIGTQVAYIFTDLWLAYWTEEEEKKQFMNLTDMPIQELTDHDEDDFRSSLLNFSLTFTTIESAYIYGGLVIILFLMAICRSILSFKIMIKSSRNLHDRMFRTIIKSPTIFFDTNPAGRILNRFTKDIGTMDDQLPQTFFDFLQISLHILGTVILTIIVNVYVFILVAPLSVIFVFLRRYALSATRAIKRLDGITRSPIFSHNTTSFQGLVTIRAYNKQKQFIEDFNRRQDQHSAAWFAFLAANRWFGLRLDLIMVVFTAGVTFVSVPLVNTTDPGLIALILSNALSLTTIFQFVVRQSALVENQMTSVERVIEYTKLESEAPLTNPKKKPPPTWPQFGALTFNSLSLNYSTESPRVLKNLSCNIMPKEKVGIVGRTGAGKSSLITALFRLTEPSGIIMLDGITTTELGLHDLRTKLSIIPQDPVLFTGNLRYNLDPFSRHSDVELWNSLDDVQLRSVVQDSPDKLNMEVGESGSNFSVGQRQLICLARAILRQNRVLIMDEATANVDPRTDALIQKTIRTKFQDCTVLTIAHRLNTIMDSDRIMVLDSGELLEFDQPHALLQRPEGMLSKLVEQTGKTEAAQLIEIAKKHFKQRRISGADGHVTFASPEELTVDGYQQQIQQWGLTGAAGASAISTESKGIQTDSCEHHVVLLPITAEGFGFSVAGSTDKPNMPIIVAQVVPDSPASFPYALQVNDEILAVNGEDRAKLTYAEVCQMIKDSKDRVQLLVRRRKSAAPSQKEEKGDGESNGLDNNGFEGSPPSQRKHSPTQDKMEQPNDSASSGRSSMAFVNEGFEGTSLSAVGESTDNISPSDIQVRPTSVDSSSVDFDTKL
ncbi:multidrug resistance-associated protein 4-like [Asterias rubens]|uniref:multidrug resistance-associated protein 4-like n=1 Tax=Asterias rubens TaxID=7604 RepID=UPI0014552227|nr:multidrug resistance-associated protein 4-like [Asterias rubens]